MGRDNRQFMALDALRGIAALAIVARHTPALWGRPAGSYDPTWLPESYLAVDFFFALSGFVVSHAYAQRLESKATTPAQFMVLRLVRFYPLHIAGLLIGVVSLYLLHAPLSTLLVLFGVGLLFAPLRGPMMFPINGPVWSLHFELVINLVYALIVPVLRTSVLIGLVTIAGMGLSLSVWHGWLGFGTSGEGPMADGYSMATYGAGLARVTFSFFAGVLAHRIFGFVSVRNALPTLIPASVLALILCASPAAGLRAPFELMAVLFGFPAIVLLGACCRPTGPATRLYSALGLSSYAVYVLHVPLYRLVFETGGSITYPWPVGVAFAGAMIAAALLADRFYDQPTRRLFANWMSHPAKPLPDTEWIFALGDVDPRDLAGNPIEGIAMQRRVKGALQFRPATLDEQQEYTGNIAT